MIANQSSKILLKEPKQKVIFEGVIGEYTENRKFLEDIGVIIDGSENPSIVRSTVHRLRYGKLGLQPYQWSLLNEQWNQLPQDKRDYWLKEYRVRTT